MHIILKPGAVVLLLLTITGLSVLVIMRVRSSSVGLVSSNRPEASTGVKRDIVGKKRFDGFFIADKTAGKYTEFAATDLPAGVSPEATRFELIKPVPNIWDVQGSAKIGERIDKGRMYIYRIWARSPTKSKISVTLEQSDAPFTNVFAQEATLTAEWKEYTFLLTPPNTYAPGDVSVRVRAALAPGVVEATVPTFTPQ